MDRSLILPGDPEFDFTLATSPPPGWGQTANRGEGSFHFVVEPGSGLMRAVTPTELTDYLEGGEYDDRLDEIEGDWDDWEE